jgi:ligand-binding sensor domain-containing protein/serine phosphatase RsbU (regulator of sigma subunit)
MLTKTHFRPDAFRLLFWVFFLFPAILAAQQSHKAVKFDKIGTEEGLSQSSVLSIAQDFRGFMWFGTQNGLNRYDGYAFEVFRTQNDSTSILSNFVQQIFEDSKKNLWIAAGGLQTFNHETQTFRRFRHNPNDPNSLPSNLVQCFFEDHFGNLWIGTNNGLARLKADKTGKPVFEVFRNDANKNSSLSNNTVLCIYQDSERSLWVGTENGLNRMNPDRRTFTRFEHVENNSNSLPHSTIRSMCEDTRGNMWIATPNGLSCLATPHRSKGYFVNYKREKYPEIVDDNIKVCYKDKDGWVWVGTVDGLNRIVLGDDDKPYFLKYQSNPLDRYSLSDNHIVSIAEDRDGVLWFGSFLGGINKFDKNKEKFISISKLPTAQSTLPDNNVTAFCEDEKSIWVGTGYGGLSRVTILGDKLTFRNFKQGNGSITHNHITDIKKGQDGYIWVATFGGGLCRIDPVTEQVLAMRARAEETGISSDMIRCIMIDEDRSIWVATNKGIDVIKYDQKVIHYKNGSNGFKGGEIKQILAAKNDMIWLASNKGLYQYDKKTDYFTLISRDFSQNTTLSSNHINFIHEDLNGILWVGTDAGLNRFDPKKGNFRIFTEKDGLANNNVMGILEDGHYNLWITTLKGISKFNVQTEAFRNYDITDGLQSNEFNPGAVLKGRSGKFYVGGLNGFNVFDPQVIKDNQNSPDIVITNFMVNNKKMPLKHLFNRGTSEARKIYLEADQNNFSFEFSALQYSEPMKNLYAYRLEGFDGNWIFTGAERRFASYTNMPDGEYTFMVRGANSDGVWNEIGTSVILVVQPPVWKTWWFRVFLVVTAIIIVGFISQRAVIFKRKANVQQAKFQRAEILEEARIQREIEERSRMGALSNLEYASQIQRAILPDEHDLRSLIPHAVHYSKPVYSVSADFFWVGEKYGKIILAVVDCSGKGVTGAFMSFVVNAMLNEIVNVKGYTDAHLILRELDKSVRKSFYKGTLQGEEEIEVGVCTINPKNKTLEFAGAKNNLLVIQDGKPEVFKGDRHTINGAAENEIYQYGKHLISYEKPTCFYTYTDGFADQFGGLTGKKFKMATFRDLLFQIHELPLPEQQRILKDTFENWVGDKHEQIDDVLVIAFRLGFEKEKENTKSQTSVAPVEADA